MSQSNLMISAEFPIIIDLHLNLNTAPNDSVYFLCSVQAPLSTGEVPVWQRRCSSAAEYQARLHVFVIQQQWQENAAGLKSTRINKGWTEPGGHSSLWDGSCGQIGQVWTWARPGRDMVTL